MTALGRSPLNFLSSLPAHGDLVRIKLGPWPAHVVCSPDLAYQVLANDRVFDKGGPIWGKLRKLMGNSVATVGHDDHRQQRRLLQPAFHRARLPGYARIMNNQIDSAMASWHDDQVLDVLAAMNSLSAAVATRTLFATDISEALVAETQRCAGEILVGGFRQLLMPFDWLSRLPTPGNRRYQQAWMRLRALLGQFVTDYRRSGVDHGDFLSMLLGAGEDGERFTDEEIYNQVLAFFFAGSETTSTALSWAWYLLGRNPDIRVRFHDEIDTVLDGRAPTYEDIPELELTGRIITEALRMYPPGWLSTRRTTTGTELGGQRLPAGTVILFSPYLLHHRADLFPNPDRFDPDRWLNDHERTLPRGAYVPFAAGARKCIGDRFALTETTLALASIAGRWQFDPLPNGRLHPTPRLTLAPHDLRMRLRRRP